MTDAEPESRLEPAEAFISRELSWLAFARRVLALVESDDLPLLERIEFAGIMGMLHDEFFMKRMSGLKRLMSAGSHKLSIDGRLPAAEFEACRAELLDQTARLERVVQDELCRLLAQEGAAIHDFADLSADQQASLRRYFQRSVMPILTPLAVDAEHPFPFISDRGLNLAVLLPVGGSGRRRFVRVKVPNNRPRWVPVDGGQGVVPLEQVIAANLDLLLPGAVPEETHVFRVTRGADGPSRHEETPPVDDDGPLEEPGSIVRQVSSELKARRFAGVVRLEVDPGMPAGETAWLTKQVGVTAEDVYATDYFLGISDLLSFEVAGRSDLESPPHDPVTHPRLRHIGANDLDEIFHEIARGDILLHHPYDSFDTSVGRFLESAARDPAVLAIKLTIYRTSSDSSIVRALADAVRRGKQVSVLVEITARFSEAPNIAWGRFLEKEGAHVTYGVESLKTHVKLALVVREEGGELRRYAHFGTGNYHSGTARLYEDLGVLTCDPEICEDVHQVFNELTGAMPPARYRRLLVAPVAMRESFCRLIQREAEHARAGRPSGIHAKMNQLQDPTIIRELYAASRAGVPIVLQVRGLCCLRPGVVGLSDSIRVYSIVGRFLEHGRIYRFENAGDPEFFIGSADWMKRVLDKRVETIAPVLDPQAKRELDVILAVYESDNCSAWDCRSDGSYVRRSPGPGQPRLAAQEVFLERAATKADRTVAPAVPESQAPIAAQTSVPAAN